jgi:uncharacterized protein (TIGR02246 family)
MRYKHLIALAVVIAAAGAAFGKGGDEDALKALITKMAEAQAAYDPKSLEEVFAADFIEVSPVGEVDSREKVLGFYKPEAKPPADKMSLKIETGEFSIRTDGKYAIVIVRFDYQITANGRPAPPRSMRATFVCRKEKGRWKIASAQYTGMK